MRPSSLLSLGKTATYFHTVLEKISGMSKLSFFPLDPRVGFGCHLIIVVFFQSSLLSVSSSSNTLERRYKTKR
jgi:hypothetical protein